MSRDIGTALSAATAQDGQVVEEATWLRDRKHGIDQYYIDDNVTTDWYHHGQLVSKAVYDRLNPGQG